MSANGYLQIGLYVAILLLAAKPLGSYMAHVYEGERTILTPVFGPVERIFYRLIGPRATDDQGWKAYAVSMLVFNAVGFLAVYGLERMQGGLPLNPQAFSGVAPDLAFNTAVSFATNTNWQAYVGETTMSYVTQMLGLAVQNFVSAATGMVVVVALIRGLRARSASGLGNFWVDMTRTTLYILLPLAVLLALLQVSQGVVQNFSAYVPANPLEGGSQLLPMGPAASQIAIKQLGTNGGGFFNVNSSHPFENATGLSNFGELLAILLISGALCYTFGKMVGDTRQGWAVLAAMTVIFVVLLGVAEISEQAGNPLLTQLGVDQVASETQTGGNMEGKEVRFGIANSALWATATTSASNGSVNSMHDSYTPIGGLVPLFLMQLGEVVFGGVGSGLYGMIIFVILAVFIAGLMVGRTPEYLGKKIGPFEMKMAVIAILAPPLAVLVGTAVSVMAEPSAAAIWNQGPHGFSEILYAFSSMGNNNGSAFAGYGANNVVTNVLGGVAMIVARYWVAIPTLAIAGALAVKQPVPPSLGTLPTHTPLFVALLIGTVIIVGALTFIPALALGPIVEQLLLNAGKTF
ncbi:MAG TPA: potassium-transporting ATPase subunit KdpA [Candidatus Limnocylindria bacterium]|jgi:K+-transporting ATPase ATPase A chain